MFERVIGGAAPEPAAAEPERVKLATEPVDGPWKVYYEYRDGEAALYVARDDHHLPRPEGL